MYARHLDLDLVRAIIFYTLFSFLLVVFKIAIAEPQLPAQHALVVGIDHYQYADGINLINLKGAVNDARLLREALRQACVHLPDDRVLINAQATRAAFVEAWQNMVKLAKPGDTLVVTFAGHGGQEPDSVPLGELDDKDESLMFYDFKSHDFQGKRFAIPQGRIIDDELFGLFEAASDYQILVIVDACHSSGMVRAPGRKSLGGVRSGGFWNIQMDAPPAFPSLPKSGEGNPLEHVTFISAVDSDSLQVPGFHRLNPAF